MNPILDQIIVGALIFAALGFLVLPTLRRNKKGCAGGCGCSSSKPFNGK